MRVITAEDIAGIVRMPDLVDVLAEAFRTGGCAPSRQVLPAPGGSGERLVLLMPAFEPAGGGAVKIATIFPDNPARGMPAIQAAVLVWSACGTPSAVLDGTMLTRMRTGAASALASRYLSRPESRRLLVVGAGELAPYMTAAHCAVRPIREVSIWGRSPERAQAAARRIRDLVGPQVQVAPADGLQAAVEAADIVSCATGASEPVLKGAWLQPGVFVDLVGSFSPRKREADDQAVVRSRVFVDTFEGALSEAGDILQPLERGLVGRQHILGELADLVTARVPGRRDQDEITLFKSVGTAVEDLAAARLILNAAGV